MAWNRFARSAVLRRKNTMRRQAVRRGGMDAVTKRALDDLARAVVMLRVGASAVEMPRRRLGWWGLCQWHAFDWREHRIAKLDPDWLQWAHIRSVGAASGLRWVADNAVALCSKCHMGRWHDPKGFGQERRFLVNDGSLDPRRVFLNSVRTPEQLAALATAPPKKVDGVMAALDLFAELERLAPGRIAWALPRESAERLAEMTLRDDLTRRA